MGPFLDCSHSSRLGSEQDKGRLCTTPNVRWNTSPTTTGHPKRPLSVGTTRNIVLIETQLTVMRAATRYHCMGTLELFSDQSIFALMECNWEVAGVRGCATAETKI
ncbi:hypothetical protein OG21DRAFT_943432 [Imleria badia]|nr:hypothetical protein OG21DRAFT_943432 [Imleria badia]